MTKEHSHSKNSESSSARERRGGGEMCRAVLDCNLASLCDHIQSEGFNNGVFSDVVLNAMGSTYHLHRLILSRSSYFRVRTRDVGDGCLQCCQGVCVNGLHDFGGVL